MTSSLDQRPRILIIKMSAMGDIVHALPFARHLRERTAAEITWVVDKGLADLLADERSVASVLEFPRDAYAFATLPDRPLTIAGKLIRELRKMTFDVAIDLQGLVRSWTVLALARARVKIARGRYPFATRSLRHHRKNVVHAVEACLEPLSVLDIERPSDPLEIQPSWSLPERVSLPKERRVCLVPFTTWPSKHWTLQGWAQVADWLLERDQQVALIGGRADTAQAGKIQGLMTQGEKLDVLTGKLTLSKLKKFFFSARLTVGVDSGPLQVAWASGCPTLTLFGASHPGRTGPYPAPMHSWIQPSGCQSCSQRRCRRRCLQSLAPSLVIDQVEAFLFPRAGASCSGTPGSRIAEK